MANFSVAARTLVHLGAELITSDEVALNELIKNAFDAESPRVAIHFHIGVPHRALTECLNDFAYVQSSVDVPDALRTAELNIQASIADLPDGPTRKEIEAKLAALSRATDISVATEIVESMNYITIEDRGTGMDADALESVFLTIGTPSKVERRQSGTMHRTLLGNKGIGRLAMMRLGDRANVTSWTSPNSARQITFNWRLFDDPNKQITDIPLQVTQAPKQVTASGTIITITALKSAWSPDKVRNLLIGKFLRRLQNPFTPADGTHQDFPIDVDINGGPRLPIAGMKPILTQYAQIDFEMRFRPPSVGETSAADDNRVVLETELVDHRRGSTPIFTHRTQSEVARAVEGSPDELSAIGPFDAKIRWFNRDVLRKQSAIQGHTKEVTAELDAWNGGIAIYRDGFRVGFSGQSTGEDWLGLDSSALRRGGFTLNRIQVVGALEITRADNPGLVDRSNREGLIETREASLVRELLLKFAVEELRRHIDHEGREEKRENLEEAAKNAPVTIRARVQQAEQGLSEIRARVPKEVQKTVQSIANHLHFIKSEVKQFEEAARQAGERREDILELAGVGTVMAGVLHELTRTTGHTRQLIQKLAQDESPKTRVLLEKLESEIKAINTRLRQLDPLTPSGRHRKEEFDLMALLETIVHGYAARFERHQIECQITVSGQDEIEPVKVHMVRGFVSLAVENLITNSVYWLQQGLQTGESQRRISLELDPKARTLTVRDNGPGIAHMDRDRIFTAGFSMRPRGQGLGLFIAAEVATYHDAKLVLDAADDDGRYRGFVLELPKD